MKVLLLQGHPDANGGHFCHALGDTYAQAAREAGHEVRTLDIARARFSLLRSATQWHKEKPAEAIRAAQAAITRAEHLVLVFPLWLGDMPALLKGYLEQVMRPGFAIGEAAPGRLPAKLLKGRSARIVVTMGMPAVFYRLYYRSHSVKSLQRNILGFCGFSPVRVSLVGTVESATLRETWLAKMHLLGLAGR